MTSPYNEKVNKLNTALENVYLKKADLIDELGDILDIMIDSETPITVNITTTASSSGGVSFNVSLINYKTSEVYDTNDPYTTSLYHTMTYTNNIVSFEMPILLSFEDSILSMVATYMGQSYYSTFYLYELEDTDNDKIINANIDDLPTSPPNE